MVGCSFSVSVNHNIYERRTILCGVLRILFLEVKFGILTHKYFKRRQIKMKVIKRNGQETNFRKQKIIDAVTKANNTVSPNELTESIRPITPRHAELKKPW